MKLTTLFILVLTLLCSFNSPFIYFHIKTLMSFKEKHFLAKNTKFTMKIVTILD